MMMTANGCAHAISTAISFDRQLSSAAALNLPANS